MIRNSTHLDDDRLMGIALAGHREQDGGALEHLTCCADCDARLRSLVRLLDADRREAGAEVDAAFTPARLATQRSRIMRRLDGVARAARVLEFPDTRASAAGSTGRPPLARRWVAAAAVIGLVAGLGTSFLMDGRSAPSQVAETRLVTPPVAFADDDLLGDIDQALLELPAPELRAIDALTPVSHEINVTSR
jgi:hypothetical protein